MIPACPSLMYSFMYSFNRGNVEATNSSKICVWCLCACFVFVCLGIGIVDWLEKGFVHEKSFEVCVYLWESLVVLRWHLAVDRTLSPVTATAVCMVLVCNFMITWCLFWETFTVVINDTDCWLVERTLKTYYCYYNCSVYGSCVQLHDYLVPIPGDIHSCH